jgi:hypothetical protein
VPTFEATRVLLAAVDDVWAFVSEPHNLPHWWPGVSAVAPDRRGFAAGARWQIVGDATPSLLHRPRTSETLVVSAVEPKRRFAFELTGRRQQGDLELAPAAADRTRARLVVTAPLVAGLARSVPRHALDRLHALVQTGAEV